MHTEITRALQFARALTIHRARYYGSKLTDDRALEAWEDASAGFYDEMGYDHPMARYASFEEEGDQR